MKKIYRIILKYYTNVINTFDWDKIVAENLEKKEKIFDSPAGLSGWRKLSTRKNW